MSAGEHGLVHLSAVRDCHTSSQSFVALHPFNMVRIYYKDSVDEIGCCEHGSDTNWLGKSSGVKVSQECLEQFQSLKLGKKTKYIIYTLSPDNTEIVVSKTSESQNYDDFLAELPPAECRYAIYDFEYQKGDEGKRNKICFFTWCVLG